METECAQRFPEDLKRVYNRAFRIMKVHWKGDVRLYFSLASAKQSLE